MNVYCFIVFSNTIFFLSFISIFYYFTKQRRNANKYSSTSWMYSNTFKDEDIGIAGAELLANRQHHDVITFSFYQLIYKGPNVVSKRQLVNINVWVCAFWKLKVNLVQNWGSAVDLVISKLWVNEIRISSGFITTHIPLPQKYWVPRSTTNHTNQGLKKKKLVCSWYRMLETLRNT